MNQIVVKYVKSEKIDLILSIFRYQTKPTDQPPPGCIRVGVGDRPLPSPTLHTGLGGSTTL